MKAKNIQYKLHNYYSTSNLSEEAKKYLSFTTHKDSQGYTRTQWSAEVPCKVDWCSACNGTGGRSKFDVEGYNINEMLYEDGVIDTEFAEDYFSGRTDVCCNVCNGTKIENIIDYDSLNEAQKEIIKKDDFYYEQDRIDEAIRRAESGYCW